MNCCELMHENLIMMDELLCFKCETRLRYNDDRPHRCCPISSSGIYIDKFDRVNCKCCKKTFEYALIDEFKNYYKNVYRPKIKHIRNKKHYISKQLEILRSKGNAIDIETEEHIQNIIKKIESISNIINKDRKRRIFCKFIIKKVLNRLRKPVYIHLYQSDKLIYEFSKTWELIDFYIGDVLDNYIRYDAGVYDDDEDNASVYAEDNDEYDEDNDEYDDYDE